MTGIDDGLRFFSDLADDIIEKDWYLYIIGGLIVLVLYILLFT